MDGHLMNSSITQGEHTLTMDRYVREIGHPEDNIPPEVGKWIYKLDGVIISREEAQATYEAWKAVGFVAS